MGRVYKVDEFAVGFIALLSCFAISWLSIHRMILKHSGLKQFTTAILGSGSLYFLLALYRIANLEEMQEWTDGKGHHYLGEVAAYRLETEGLGRFLLDIKPGNVFYQSMTGVAYFTFGSHPEIIYAASACLGFMSVVLLLDSLVRVFPNAFPGALIYCTAAVLFLPTALFWSPFNLKEGPIAWCIVSLLRIVSYSKENRVSIYDVFVALLGVFLRPHIYVCWLAGVGFTRLFFRFNIVFALFFLAIGCVCLLLVESLIPGSVTDFANTVSEAEAMTEKNSATQGNFKISGKPIPFFTGGLLLLIRPYPWEINSISSLATGLEIWTFTLLGLVGWLRCKRKLQLLQTPLVMTCIISFILLCLPFSFFYNMGLLARQRLQAYPAIVVISLAPYLQAIADRTSQRITIVGLRKLDD